MWPLRPIRILSIDGGGIRGIIPALVLQELSRRMKHLGRNRPLHSCFDLIAGTSTGGLIALGLTAPKPNSQTPMLSIDEIVEMYRHEGEKIFPPWKFRVLHSVAHAFREKYSLSNFDDFLGDTLGEATLHDALTDVLITTFDVERNAPFFFKRRAGRTDDTNFRMIDVAKATAAAPSYFEPAIISAYGNPSQEYCMVDGAVYANNPAMCAYIEVRKLYPHGRRYTLLSLGTGKPLRELERDDLDSWGYFDWISPMRGAPLFGIISTGQSETVDYQLSKLSGLRYYRFNGTLGSGHPDMDDAGPENIERLSAAAEKIISQNSEALDRLARTL